jgi:phosphohistidine phosphatase
MKLIFVRHAEALDRTAAMTDEMRYLTSEGRGSFRKTARTLLKQGVEPSLILTSPLIRAVQTAEILAETLAFFGPLLVRNELRPGFDMEKLQNLLNEFQSADEVVFVGHEPDLSGLITALLSLPDGFNLKKGAAVKLKSDPKNLQNTTLFKWLAIGNKLIRKCDELSG